MVCAILFDEELKEYDFGEGHPFRGDRYIHFARELAARLPENNTYRLLKAEPATDEDLQLISNQNYIEFTRGYYESANLGIKYPGRFTEFQSMDNMPTGWSGKIEEAARLVIGQAKLACHLVEEGKYEKAISIGGGLHHAKPNYGEGFCLYNDVAFCARYLLNEYKLNRILILDTDAHAGNGTAEYFYENSSVLFIDIHQHPRSIYPYTGFPQQVGSGDGRGFNINIPLPEFAGDEAYRMAFEKIVEPVAAEFKPQIIIRNGGSDPHYEDGLTDLGLSLQGFRMIGEKTRTLSTLCNGKEIDLIASGYNRNVLPVSWLALLSGLMGVDVPLNEAGGQMDSRRINAAQVETREIIDEVKGYLKDFWKCMK